MRNVLTKINPIIYGIIYSMIFGFSFMFTKIALPNIIHPVQLIMLRLAIAFVFLSVLSKLKIIKINLEGKKIKEVLILCIFQPILYFMFETLGVQYVSSSQAGIMIATIPIFVLIFARIILKEKLKNITIFYILLSFIGALIINYQNLSVSTNVKGIIYLFIAVLSGALYTTLSRKASNKFSAIEITYLMMLVGTVFFTVVTIIYCIKNRCINEIFKPLTDLKTLLSILYLGILSSGIAFLLLNYVLSKIEASKACVFNNFTTVVSVIAGIFILGETLTWQQYIGCIIILIGVYGTQKKRKKEKV